MTCKFDQIQSDPKNVLLQLRSLTDFICGCRVSGQLAAHWKDWMSSLCRDFGQIGRTAHRSSAVETTIQQNRTGTEINGAFCGPDCSTFRKCHCRGFSWSVGRVSDAFVQFAGGRCGSERIRRLVIGTEIAFTWLRNGRCRVWSLKVAMDNVDYSIQKGAKEGKSRRIWELQMFQWFWIRWNQRVVRSWRAIIGSKSEVR
jgi:hypothetical protein